MAPCDVRDATIRDCIALQDIYTHLNPDDSVLPETAFRAKLAQTIDDPQQHLIVADLGGVIVASCTLHILQNLTRGARPFGLIENVVTHKSHRRLGLGKLVLAEATQRTHEAGCYKLMLMTGSSRPSTLAFYRSAGFEQSKTGFQIRF